MSTSHKPEQVIQVPYKGNARQMELLFPGNVLEPVRLQKNTRAGLKPKKDLEVVPNEN